MKRERIRPRVARTVERRAARADGNVVRLTDRTRAAREPSGPWEGLRSFLAALPRVCPPPTGRGSEIGNHRSRSAHGDDAA
jgi:hypothetical protein